jgi:hypothetical protein
MDIIRTPIDNIFKFSNGIVGLFTGNVGNIVGFIYDSASNIAIPIITNFDNVIKVLHDDHINLFTDIENSIKNIDKIGNTILYDKCLDKKNNEINLEKEKLKLFVENGINTFITRNIYSVINFIPMVIRRPKRFYDYQIDNDNSNNNNNEKVCFFINGICTDNNNLKNSCEKIQNQKYKDKIKVKGIHNPSDGIFLDLIECIYQRYFERQFIESEPVKHTCKTINKYIENKNIKEIILIGHSQGCIILDLAIKRIHRDMINKNNMNIFNIYTFANPVLPGEFFKDVTGIDKNNVEHFYNKEDFVAGLGIAILENEDKKNKITEEINKEKRINYISNIFCSKPCCEDQSEKSGHLFGAHYSLRKSDYIDGNNSNFLID